MVDIFMFNFDTFDFERIETVQLAHGVWEFTDPLNPANANNLNPNQIDEFIYFIQGSHITLREDFVNIPDDLVFAFEYFLQLRLIESFIRN